MLTVTFLGVSNQYVTKHPAIKIIQAQIGFSLQKEITSSKIEEDAVFLTSTGLTLTRASHTRYLFEGSSKTNRFNSSGEMV
jgi:hypothetical protein